MNTKTKQNNLWNSTEQIELLLSNLQTGVIIVDKESKRILEANAFICKLSGQRKEDLVGRICHEAICPKSQYSCPADNIVPGSNDKISGECSLVTRDAQEIPILKTISTVKLNDREYLLESIVDISEQKKVEQRLRQERERVENLARKAEEASLAKSEFLANISHELRTPLNGVIGMASLLKETTLTEDQKCYADTMYTCAELLLKLVNGVLDYSSLETGSIELHKRKFSPRNLIHSVVEYVKKPIAQKELKFSFEIPSEIPLHLVGDPSRLQQVLLILVENAIKFTNKGSIYIHIALIDQSTSNCTLRFSISDTGIGIPKEKHKHVFERFTQVDSSTTRKYGGTGLGLATAKQIIDLMDGEIYVRSRQELGTIFWFEVTLNNEISPPVAPFSDTPKTILIVDDSLTNCQVMQTMLLHLGYQARIATSGEQAIEELANQSIDLIFMDIQMPNMNGIATCKAIRSGIAGESTNETPIVALSASDYEDDLSWKYVGMNDCLTKPVSPQNLKTYLQKWFPSEPTQAQKYNFSTPSSSSTKPLVQKTYTSEIFDRQKLLTRLMGDKAVLTTVVKGFIGDMPGQINQLGTLIASGELKAAKIRAHGIKGASATICADKMSRHCAKMEQYAELGDTETLASQMDTLLYLYNELKTAAQHAPL